MTNLSGFDVIVVGGGIVGSTLAGVLARSGVGVLVLEKEERFRDRVRGEGTWPYGVADAPPWASNRCLPMPGSSRSLGSDTTLTGPWQRRTAGRGRHRQRARDWLLPSPLPGSRLSVGGVPGRDSHAAGKGDRLLP